MTYKGAGRPERASFLVAAACSRAGAWKDDAHQSRLARSLLAHSSRAPGRRSGAVSLSGALVAEISRRCVSAMKDRHATRKPDQESSLVTGRGESFARDSPVAFIIVLTLESRGQSSDLEWRWRVRSVQTNEERQFREVADVLAFVATRANASIPP
ncbi:MAG: hypothetical protein IT338_18700 [Thermomicrobiales bacterium]|nr:hypothetical protein [Thermomicrobiales bacterium]